MRKQTTLLGMCVTCIYLLQLYSCIKPPHDFDPRDGNNDFKPCFITQISFNIPPGGYVEWLKFTYNANKDPVTVTPSHIGTGSPKLSFIYDKKDRLFELMEGYGAGGNEYGFVHKYFYDKQDRIVKDSSDFFGWPDPPLYLKITRLIRYDKLNRVILDSAVYINGATYYVNRYEYDDSGNRIRFGFTYDSKVNIHRSNKIWMFIDRDYSVNNPLIAINYNRFGFPLLFPASNDEIQLISFLGYSINDAPVEYECK
jgi:hypothetical protein